MNKCFWPLVFLLTCTVYTYVAALLLYSYIKYVSFYYQKQAQMKCH